MALPSLFVLTLSGCQGEAELPPTPAHPHGPHQSNEGVDWRDQVIYQVLVDRWDDGDPSNNVGVDPSSMVKYHGGDWRGVVDRLDYLEALGITALWISPVVENVEEHVGSAGYHGYTASDFVRPNLHFGDVATLRELVDAAHARGILVILDIVTNHIGQLFYYDYDEDGTPEAELVDGGVNHTCHRVCEQTPDDCSADELRYCEEAGDALRTVNEWDPPYDPRGARSAERPDRFPPLRFLEWPEVHRRAPPRPPADLRWPADLPWFDEDSWYHRHGRIPGFFTGGSYSRRFVRELEAYSDFGGGLFGLDTDNPVVQEALFRAYAYWVEVADFDGFRIDTVKHVDTPDLDPHVRGFWGDFAPRMRAFARSLGKHNFFMFGEAFDGDDHLVGSYTEPGQDARGVFTRLDSMLHFATKFRAVDEVLRYGGPTRNIECLVAARFGGGDESQGWCAAAGFPHGPTFHTQSVARADRGGTGVPPAQLLVNFIDNHDMPRYLSTGASVESLHGALFFLLTWDGVPSIYYGTEQLFAGGEDPHNREDMWQGNTVRGLPPFDTAGSTFRYVQALIAMRRAHPALRRGDIIIRWSTTSPRGDVDSGLLAFERASPDETALVVLNTASEQASVTCSPSGAGGGCMPTSFPAGTVLRDVAPVTGGATYQVSESGTLNIRVEPSRGLVLVPVQ